MTGGGGVTVLIPTWNRADLLGRVLADLNAQTRRPESVIVIDDGSTDNSCEVAAAAGAGVVRLPRNSGFARAVNAGVAECATEWTLILNNDVSVASTWLERLLDAAESSSAWFATGKLLMRDNPGMIDGTYDAICRGGTAWRCGHGRQDGDAWNQPCRIHLTPMTALLVRRALFDEIGLLDENYGMYLEDVDFGLRCAAACRTGVYVPGAVGVHSGSATLGPWHKATVRKMARNQMLLVRKHFGGAPVGPIMVAQLLWGITAARHGAGWSWLQGRRDGASLRVDPIPGQWNRIRAVVTESESMIRKLQARTGFERYWRLYFALTRS